MRTALIFVLLVGCGDGGAGGTPITFSPPNRSGNDTFAGGGADRQTSTDKGSGTTTAVGGFTESNTEAAQAPEPCSKTTPCDHGTCSSTSGGFCIDQCTGDACAAGYQCITVEKIKYCVIPCTTTADCPVVVGLTAACVTLSSGATAKFCNWGRAQATPS